jgi:hypothetical protein
MLGSRWDHMMRQERPLMAEKFCERVEARGGGRVSYGENERRRGEEDR